MWIEKAREVARIAHAGQKRRNGEDYFLGHIERVAKIVTERAQIFHPRINHEFVIAAAYLHDVIEDTNYDLSDFPDKIVGTVKAVTRQKGQNYFDFITSIFFSPYREEARTVKLADLEHNMSNLEEGSMKDKYRFAHYVLERSYDDF